MSLNINKDALEKFNYQNLKKKYTILIVDDEESNLRALRKCLDSSYNLLEASDGQEALELLLKLPNPNIIQLIITDQRMPHLNGIQFLEKSISLIPFAIRIILTAHIDQDDIIDAINKGNIYKFIIKPFEPNEIKLTIKRSLEAYELHNHNLLLKEELSEKENHLKEEIDKRKKVELEKQIQEQLLIQKTQIAEQAEILKHLNSTLNDTLKQIRFDLNFAKRIQEKLLPLNFQIIQDLKFTFQYIPIEEVGGDIFDIIELPSGIIRIFLADATGHGVQAALITMLIKSEYEVLKSSQTSTANVLDKLNKLFLSKYYSLGTFFSCIICDVDLKNGHFTYSSAGHPFQVMISKTEGITKLNKTGRAIGLKKNTEFIENQMPFRPGDKLLLYTDGIFEEFNDSGEQFGEEQILNLIKQYQNLSAQFIGNIILKSLYDFLSSSSTRDDITFIGVEWKEEIK
ncbi:MAG: fused response regulator/phosphatase [Leptospiraceae bacterium]|nr:fused response regulator/phosphatase [Leptospiraceae bacterium]MCP5501009.1 fused response regulator/phosphatase [Leptospiraceae bacterium]